MPDEVDYRYAQPHGRVAKYRAGGADKGGTGDEPIWMGRWSPVALRRAFVDRKPVTWYRLTANGRKALDKHLRALQDMISTAAS